MKARITIIIPFYQRESGILTKALRSVFTQKTTADFHVIIVDDESPVPADAEIAELSEVERAKITIFLQRNGGPAAARNRGLAHMGAETEYVAFLDSDDVWSENHLSNALVALDAGHDFYFANHLQLGATVGAFERASRISPEDHPTIGNARALRAFKGDMFDQILRGNVVGTSTVVYRYRKFPELRFREEFVNAGEDYLFWMSLARVTDRVAFSTEIEAIYGKGVNVFSGSGWGTPQSLISLHYQIKYKKAVPHLFHVNAVQAKAIDQSVRGLRVSFVRDVLHHLAHHRPLDRIALRAQWLHDPQSYFFFFPITIRILATAIADRLKR